MKKTLATLAATALVATPLAAAATLATGGPAAAAETTKRGQCGPGTYEFQVDREDAEDGGGYEVSADLDRVGAGTTWTIVIRHDGKRVGKVTRTADSDGDVDLDVNRSNTRGKDVFSFRAKGPGGATCKATVTRA